MFEFQYDCFIGFLLTFLYTTLFLIKMSLSSCQYQEENFRNENHWVTSLEIKKLCISLNVKDMSPTTQYTM